MFSISYNWWTFMKYHGQKHYDQSICCLPASWPLMKTRKAWPADKTVSTGYVPLLKKSSLGSILTLKRADDKMETSYKSIKGIFLKTKFMKMTGRVICYSLCHVPQIISDISSGIYLLQQSGRGKWNVTISGSLVIVSLPRESSMNRNTGHLHPCTLRTNLYT